MFWSTNKSYANSDCPVGLKTTESKTPLVTANVAVQVSFT